MARPLRIQYPGAVYHVTCRGNERKDIFGDDSDRKKMLEIMPTSETGKQAWYRGNPYFIQDKLLSFPPSSQLESAHGA